MTMYPSKIERLRGLQESSFVTDGSGTIGNFFEIPFHEGTLALELLRPTQTPMHAQQRLGGYPVPVLMPKAATLGFECNLETITTKATSAVTPASHWLAEMTESALGGANQAIGTIVTGATITTSSLPLLVATTVRPGCAIGLVRPSDGALEIREVKSKTGSQIALKLATTSAAASSSIAYGATTSFYHTRQTSALNNYMQFIAEGFETDDRWLLRGGALESLAFTFGPATIPKLGWKWKFARWDLADGGSSSAYDGTGNEIGAATYTNTVTLVQADSEHRAPTVGTATLTSTLIESSTIEITPNIQWVPVHSSSGTNTIVAWVKAHAAPVISGSFTLPYEDQAWFTAHTSRTAKAHFLQIGSTTTDGGVLISVPNTRITGTPERVDVGGVQGLKVSFVSLLDTDTTAESGYEALAESPFRIHYL